MTTPSFSLFSGLSHAELTTDGAHVSAWRIDDDHPVLWSNDLSKAHPGLFSRGGLQLAAPWIEGGDFTGSPGSGFEDTCDVLSLAQWKPLLVESDVVRMQYHHQPEAHGDLFPHRFSADYTVSVDDEDLLCSLTLTNDDDHEITLSTALYAFVAVGDIKDISILGLHDTACFDYHLGAVRPHHEELALIGPTARVYEASSSVIVNDPRWLRAVSISKEGSGSTVVWNPWAEYCANDSRWGSDDWQHFVCIGAACTGSNALTLSPGDNHTLALSLRSDALV